MRELNDSTVVITGAANGIGRALALGFLADGARVVGTDIDEGGLTTLADAGAIVQRTDVTSDQDVRSMIARAIDETGRVDVVVNNAGYGANVNVEDLADGDFERMMAVHAFAAVYAMRAAFPHMRRQRHGRVINIISRAAETNPPGWAGYGAAKAAMWAASRSAAAEVRDDGILVNMLFPGMTNTAIWGREMPGMQEPAAVYPTARLLATLPDDGPSGEVFYREVRYQMFDVANDQILKADQEERRSRAAGQID